MFFLNQNEQIQTKSKRKTGKLFHAHSLIVNLYIDKLKIDDRWDFSWRWVNLREGVWNQENYVVIIYNDTGSFVTLINFRGIGCKGCLRGESWL